MRALILGANGSLARHTLPFLLADTTADVTLYLRRAHRLRNPDPARVRVVEGDVLDTARLQEAMRGQDVVYANLSGDLARQARSIIDAMHDAGVQRLIFISSMGIYGEVPGERYRSVLDPYRDAARLVEASDLDYTVLRPGWFVHESHQRLVLTARDEPFVGHDVSLDALSQLIVSLIQTPGLHVRESLGVSTQP